MPVDREFNNETSPARVDLKKRTQPVETVPPSAAQTNTAADAIVPTPLEFHAPTPPAAPPGLALAVAGGVGIVVVLVLMVALFSSGGGGSQASTWPQTQVQTSMAATEDVTACATAPSLAVSRVVADGDALDVTIAITAGCAGGDVLSTPRARIAITSGSLAVAAGICDLSAMSIAVPPSAHGTVSQVFRFPSGTFWRTPDLIGDTSALQAQFTQLAPATSTQGRTGSAIALPVTMTPSDIDPESTGLAALQAIANADAAAVTGRLMDHWVPQVSSKQDGMVAEGTTWRAADILREHLQLRLRYPNVRLVWSGAWATFSPGYWVTVVGVTFGDSGPALDWCRSNQLDRDHCYAKVISNTFPVDASTVLQPN